MAYYSYDKAERISGLRYLKSGNGVAYFDYSRDAAGRITKINREGSKAIYYRYDSLDRLIGETWLRKSNTTQAYAFLYDYDLSHNRTRMRRELGAGVVWESTYYVYPANDQPRKAQLMPANTTTYYKYNLNGALTKMFDTASGGKSTYFEYGP